MWKRRICPLCLCALWLCAMLPQPAAIAQSMTISYAPNLSEVFANPYTGLAVWAADDEHEQPFSLVYANLSWAEFEPEEGVYDFASFEESNALAQWRENGKRLILRFVMDTPGSKKHRDIPEWLYDQTGDGTAYSTDYGCGYSPNYENETLIAAHARAIAALAEHYADDDFVAFIQLGSVGHWGEWHVHSRIGQLPDIAVLERYVQPYLNAFPHARLMTRRPFSFAAENNFGLYNDTSAEPQSTATWLDWIRNGGAYQGVDGLLAPMSNAWQTAPIGGEVATSLDEEDILIDDVEQTLQLFADSHTSWIGPHGFADIEPDSEAQPALNTLLTRIGYRLRVESATLTPNPDSSRQLTLKWQNDGIAPFYFDDWTINLRCTSPEGEISLLTVPLSVSDILPGTPAQATVTLPQGAYTVYVGITDPEGEAAVALGMYAPQDGLWYELMSLE